MVMLKWHLRMNQAQLWCIKNRWKCNFEFKLQHRHKRVWGEKRENNNVLRRFQAASVQTFYVKIDPERPAAEEYWFLDRKKAWGKE